MKNKTTEFSFILKPAKHGIGVFAVHKIKKGAYLRLFAEENKKNRVSFLRNKKDIPKPFKAYCISRNKKVICPRDFGRMELGWFINHSNSPNAYPEPIYGDYDYYSLRDIKAGEEITIDYNNLGEPEKYKDLYYKRNKKNFKKYIR